MSDAMDYYSDEEMAEPLPKPRGVSAIATKAGAAVGGAAKAVADSAENTGDRIRIWIDRMDKWASQGRVRFPTLKLITLSITYLQAN